MAFHGPVNIPANTMTLLNATSVTELTITNDSRSVVSLIGTAAAVAPSDMSGRVVLASGDTLLSSTTIAALWPGVAAEFVWAYCSRKASVQVSHA